MCYVIFITSYNVGSIIIITGEVYYKYMQEDLRCSVFLLRCFKFSEERNVFCKIVLHVLAILSTYCIRCIEQYEKKGYAFINSFFVCWQWRNIDPNGQFVFLSSLSVVYFPFAIHETTVKPLASINKECQIDYSAI